jgi:hypothetical protein
MIRRLTATIALVACAGIYAFAESERVNFILTNGERKSGTVAFHGGDHENLINGHLNIATQDKDMTFPVEQVAVIDFIGGRPTPDETAQLGTGHMLVMRDGTTQQGRFVNMIGGDTLIWDNQAGQRQQYAIRDVRRVYLIPDSARTVFAARGGRPTAVATNGQIANGTTVRVDARQAWTDTGITVNLGDRVVFNASGQIQWGQGPGMTSDPNGNGSERRATYPDPSVPVGALLGKIGNSAPFAIGMQTQPLVMPAAGRLMLGVNDNELNDNGGFYSVVVAKQ